MCYTPRRGGITYTYIYIYTCICVCVLLLVVIKTIQCQIFMAYKMIVWLGKNVTECLVLHINSQNYQHSKFSTPHLKENIFILFLSIENHSREVYTLEFCQNENSSPPMT